MSVPVFAALEFQSTPSVRRATVKYEVTNQIIDISIHALREESDGKIKSARLRNFYFNPRPP